MNFPAKNAFVKNNICFKNPWNFVRQGYQMKEEWNSKQDLITTDFLLVMQWSARLDVFRGNMCLRLYEHHQGSLKYPGWSLPGLSWKRSNTLACWQSARQKSRSADHLHVCLSFMVNWRRGKGSCRIYDCSMRWFTKCLGYVRMSFCHMGFIFLISFDNFSITKRGHLISKKSLFNIQLGVPDT